MVPDLAGVTKQGGFNQVCSSLFHEVPIWDSPGEAFICYFLEFDWVVLDIVGFPDFQKFDLSISLIYWKHF